MQCVFLILLLAFLNGNAGSAFDSFPNYEAIWADRNAYAKASQSCLDQILQLQSTTWLQMLDASSKIAHPGMLGGALVDLGTFDQCLAIEQNDGNGRIIGQYCTAIKMNTMIYNFSQTVCLPDACTKEDLQTVFSYLNLPLDSSTARCQTKETKLEFNNWDIGGTVFFSFILCCMITSTVYDVYTERNNQKPSDLLKAFSVYSNSKKIFTVSQGSREQVQIFAGLKFISMVWIIAGHGISAYTVAPLVNTVDFWTWSTKVYVMYLASSPLAVETFFYISGFLLPYTYLKHVKQTSMKKQTLSVPMMYIHRYLRLTPTTFALWLFVVSIYPHFGSGPLWTVTQNQQCRDHWLAFFTYVQNYNNYDDFCLLHTWYLSADMQMFLISPLILIPTAFYIKSHYRNVMYALFGVVGITMIIPVIVKYADREYTTLNVYETHSRMSSYFVGFLFGVYMRKNLDKPFLFKKNASLLNLVMWCVSLLALTFVFVMYDHIFIHPEISYTGQTMFYTFMRPIWGAGLSWMVYASYHGYGGIVDWLLSSPLMQVGSRLSYSVYLMHPIVVGHYVMSRRTPIYFTDYMQFYIWCGYFVVSFIVAYIWTVSFESPMIGIEKIIFGGSRRAPKPQEPVVQKKLEIATVTV